MGRPKGSRNHPKEAEIGDNSGSIKLTTEQKRSRLVEACGEIQPLKDEIYLINNRIRSMMKSFKEDGLDGKDIRYMLAMLALEPEEARRRAEIFEWVHPGVQAELSFDAAAE